MSEHEQNRVAHMLMAYAGPDEIDEIPAEHLPSIKKGLAELARGERISEDEMSGFFAKYGA
jgi:hypothetical protein